MTLNASWALAEGDLITPELTVLRRLGGGSAYEVFLAFDEVTYGPVVVKVVRPDQVEDEHTLRGLRREVSDILAVLVTARHQQHIKPHQPLEPCYDVRQYSRVAGTDVRLKINVVDWRRNVVFST